MSNIRSLSALLKDVAQRELNENASQIESQLTVIRSWLVECELECKLLDDQFLIAFLRGCKYSLEKAKKKLLLFYRIRAELPQVIQNRDTLDPQVLKVIQMGVAVPLPRTEKPTDPKVFLIRVGQFNVTECSFADIMKVGTMINDILMRDDDQMVICGMTLIIDLNGVTAGHMMHFEMELLRKVAILNQDASPLRLQGIHILNPPPGAQTALNIFNGLLSQKNQHKRIYLHGRELASLYRHFSLDLLPKEYGGNLQAIDYIVKEWENKLIESRLYLLKMASMNSNSFLSSKHSPTVSTEHSFGTEGSFRNLQFD